MSSEERAGQGAGRGADADPELDELLDSALLDMTKKPDPTTGSTNTIATESDAALPPNMWSEEFIKEAAAQFESNMAAILGSFGGVPEDQITQEQIAQTFSKMAEAAAQVMQPNADRTQDGAAPAEGQDPATQPENLNEVTAAIAQTLQSLSSNTDNLQAPFTDQDLANMFNNFNLDGADQEGGGNMFVPFMQGMMQSLLSKEVLYPSLKDLVDKYPAWIEENKGKVDEADLDRYKKQQELMVKVCSELESEQDSDPEDVRRKRFEVVLDLMQKMQDLGQPPTELVGEIGVPPQGFAAPAGVPGQDQQCSIM